MQREAFKAYGAGPEDLDKLIAVMIDKAIDNMPTGMVRGLTPEEAFDVVTRGAGRFVFKPKDSAPPPFMQRAIEAHVEQLVKAREVGKLDWFLTLIADAGRAEGHSEAEIDEKLAELREQLELRGPAAEGEQLVDADDAGDDLGEGNGNGEPIPEGMKGALLKLTDADAIALIDAVGENLEPEAEIEQLEQWLEVESLAKVTRKAVLSHLETKIEKLYEGEGAGGTSSPGSSSTPPAAGGQGSASPTAPGDVAPVSPLKAIADDLKAGTFEGVPPDAKPTPVPPSSAPTGAVAPSSAATKPTPPASSSRRRR